MVREPPVFEYMHQSDTGGTMEEQEKIYDNQSGWVKKHIDEYVETDGRQGHEWREGVLTLLITTRGRKSGKLRRTALIYGQDGENYVIVASKGGHPEHPAWYLNLSNNPEVHVQVEDKKFPARARTAEGEERARLWKIMTGIWPAYDEYQTKTDREIPIVVLTPVG
jgi:deazaflavin-dependent oxidoreductase (nitroreductase family)